MAKIYPNDWQQLQYISQHQAEFGTLRILQQLPDDFVVIHGAHWTKLMQHYLTSHEIDFCVVTPSGSLIIIEQKNGQLIEEEGRFFKRYGESQLKDVNCQLLSARDGLMNQFNRIYQKQLHCDVLLYCPDYRIVHTNHENPPGGLPAQRVIDQRRAAQLLAIIESMNGSGTDLPMKNNIVRFLLGHFNMTLDVGQSLHIGEAYYTFFAHEMIRFVTQLDFNPWWLRIQGSAGSGKTQLATQLLQDAAQKGQRALYLCFNRPLADHIRTLFPDQVRVETRDSLADHFLRSQKIIPEYGHGHEEDFARIRTRVMDTTVPEEWLFDFIIVDEGQDFEDDDVQLFMYFMHTDNNRTRLLWLEDPLQNIYDKKTAETICTVTLNNHCDFRCPHDVLMFTLDWLGIPKIIKAMNPVSGLKPQLILYQGANEQKTQLGIAVQQALKQGTKINDIVIVSMKGLDNHLLHADDTLLTWPLRRCNGKYSTDGKQQWTEGTLKVETIYRFKGQQAPWVIIIDVEGNWDERLQRKLYCALTRSTFSATVLIHKDTIQHKEHRVLPASMPDQQF